MGCGLLNEIINQRFLLGFGSTDIDSNYRQMTVRAVESGDQTGMGSGAAAGANKAVDANILFK